MSVLFPTYSRFPVTIAEAEGVTVKDTEGKSYLDFGSGIGVCNLGHRHPIVQTAVEEQLQKYWHVSNLYHVPLQEEVGQLLIDHTVGDYVFFCNSGAEANEAAIKLARKATGKTKIITFNQSFHGRTYATMSATGQQKIQQGFGPLLETFTYVPYNDLAAFQQALDDNTAAVMLEVIQGEGGVVVSDPEFLQAVAELCEENDVLLMIDEIQTGIGRTGKAFAYEHYGISPDVITLAKGLGNGLPVGAMIAKGKYRDVFGPGSHGTTFGGNPLAMAAAKAVLQTVLQDEFLTSVEEKGEYLLQQLNETIGSHPKVKEIRGKGFMIGIVYEDEVAPLINQLIECGLFTLSAGPNVIRLLPPLIATKEDIDQAVSLIADVLTHA